MQNRLKVNICFEGAILKMFFYCCFEDQFWKCLFEGANLKNVFSEGAILMNTWVLTGTVVN